MKNATLTLHWCFIKCWKMNQSFFFDMNNTQSQYAYRNKNESCSCNVSRANMM